MCGEWNEERGREREREGKKDACQNRPTSVWMDANNKSRMCAKKSTTRRH